MEAGDKYSFTYFANEMRVPYRTKDFFNAYANIIIGCAKANAGLYSNISVIGKSITKQMIPSMDSIRMRTTTTAHHQQFAVKNVSNERPINVWMSADKAPLDKSTIPVTKTLKPSLVDTSTSPMVSPCPSKVLPIVEETETKSKLQVDRSTEAKVRIRTRLSTSSTIQRSVSVKVSRIPAKQNVSIHVPPITQLNAPTDSNISIDQHLIKEMSREQTDARVLPRIKAQLDLYSQLMREVTVADSFVEFQRQMRRSELIEKHENCKQISNTSSQPIPPFPLVHLNHSQDKYADSIYFSSTRSITSVRNQLHISRLNLNPPSRLLSSVQNNSVRDKKPLSCFDILDEVTLKDVAPIASEYPRKDQTDEEIHEAQVKDSFLYKLVCGSEKQQLQHFFELDEPNQTNEREDIKARLAPYMIDPTIHYPTTMTVMPVRVTHFHRPPPSEPTKNKNDLLDAWMGVSKTYKTKENPLKVKLPGSPPIPQTNPPDQTKQLIDIMPTKPTNQSPPIDQNIEKIIGMIETQIIDTYNNPQNDHVNALNNVEYEIKHLLNDMNVDVSDGDAPKPIRYQMGPPATDLTIKPSRAVWNLRKTAKSSNRMRKETTRTRTSSTCAVNKCETSEQVNTCAIANSSCQSLNKEKQEKIVSTTSRVNKKTNTNQFEHKSVSTRDTIEEECLTPFMKAIRGCSPSYHNVDKLLDCLTQIDEGIINPIMNEKARVLIHYKYEIDWALIQERATLYYPITVYERVQEGIIEKQSLVNTIKFVDDGDDDEKKSRENLYEYLLYSLYTTLFTITYFGLTFNHTCQFD